MADPYTESEITAIRHLVLENANPDDDALRAVSTHNTTEVKSLIRRFLNLLFDVSTPIQRICSVFNNCQHRSPAKSPLPNHNNNSRPEAPSQQISIALPPKFRGKTAHHPSIVEPANDRSQVRIPMLPRCATSPSAVSRHLTDHIDPKIGSLAAVLHPMLGPAHVCRVLTKRPQNNGIYYLVSFFQAELSPCYVPSEYLFQLEPHIGFPLGNEPEFRAAMESTDVSVDWLLERIFSSAQNLVISHSEVLFHQDQESENSFRPDPIQIQQIMFQCVSCAALLLTCYVSCRWNIPKDKMNEILITIFKTNPSKFQSTESTTEIVRRTILQLISYLEK